MLWMAPVVFGKEVALLGSHVALLGSPVVSVPGMAYGVFGMEVALLASPSSTNMILSVSFDFLVLLCMFRSSSSNMHHKFLDAPHSEPAGKNAWLK